MSLNNSFPVGKQKADSHETCLDEVKRKRGKLQKIWHGKKDELSPFLQIHCQNCTANFFLVSEWERGEKNQPCLSPSRLDLYLGMHTTTTTFIFLSLIIHRVRLFGARPEKEGKCEDDHHAHNSDEDGNYYAGLLFTFFLQLPRALVVQHTSRFFFFSCRLTRRNSLFCHSGGLFVFVTVIGKSTWKM